MTRTEELTLKLIEAMISEEETHELEWTIASDKAAAHQHVALLELEWALRGRRQNIDVVGRVMAGLIGGGPDRAAEPSDPLAAMAMASEHAHAPDERLPDVFGPPPSSPASVKPHRRRRRRKGIPATMYVLLLLSVVLVIAAYFIRQELQRKPAVPVNQATVIAFDGSFTIVRGDKTFNGEVGSPLDPGNTINTSTNTTVTFEYDPAHVVTLRSESEAKIETGPTTRSIRLHRGTLEVTALVDTDKPHISLATPHARIAASGARYNLQVNDKRTTLENLRGLVDITSLASDESVQAKSDQRVIVEPGLPLIATAMKPADRVTDGLVVLYLFTEGRGDAVHDQSRVEPFVDLKIASPTAVTWGNRLLRVTQPTTIVTDASNAQLIEALRAGDGVTIETWLKPADDAQTGPAAIVSLGSDAFTKNITLGQGVEPDEGGHGDRYVVRFRTVDSGGAGKPGFDTHDQAAKAELTHLVFTRKATGEARFYLNGELHTEGQLAGEMASWARDAPFGLANEATGDRPWLGELRLVALYTQALSPEQVKQNYHANLVGPLPSDGETTDGPTPNPSGAWEEATYMRMTGADRSQPFVITGKAFRVRIRYSQPNDATEPVVVRLRDYRDPSRSQELLNTDKTKLLTKVIASFGEGEYFLETLGPDFTDWEFTIEQRKP